jgi:hypothetical protein
VIAGKRTRILQPGQSQVLTVRLGKAGLISSDRSDDLYVEVPGPSSFGVDGLDRVYATTIAGPVNRLDPAS